MIQVVSLSPEEIRAIVDEIAEPLAGARVRNVSERDSETLLVTLRKDPWGTLWLLLSVRPRLGRLHLVEEKPEPVASPSPFARACRRRLKGAVLESCRQVHGDRIVELSFTRGRARAGDGEGEGDPERGSSGGGRLVLEIRGGRSQLALLDPDRSLVASLTPMRRAGAEIRPGDRYRFPPAPSRSAALKGAARSPWRRIENPGSELAGDSAFPLQRAVAQSFAELERHAVTEELRDALVARLRRDIDRRSRTLDNVRGDLQRASQGARWLRSGELLKAALPTLRRGMPSVTLDDYYEPECPQVVVELDPALSPQQNVERYFKRYQKSKRAVEFLTARVATLQDEIQGAQALLDAVERASDLEGVRALQDEAQRYLRRGSRGAKGPARTAAAGPRRFVSAEGFEILVGRNAKGNDELTTRLGKGNDIFLHVAGRVGAHVVIRNVPGKSVPLETLMDAAQLALYYSLPERSRGEAALGMSAEVDYTPLKYVRKPRGGKPGLVLLATHKTLRVRLDPGHLQQIRERGAN